MIMKFQTSLAPTIALHTIWDIVQSVVLFDIDVHVSLGNSKHAAHRSVTRTASEFTCSIAVLDADAGCTDSDASPQCYASPSPSPSPSPPSSRPNANGPKMLECFSIQ